MQISIHLEFHSRNPGQSMKLNQISITQAPYIIKSVKNWPYQSTLAGLPKISYFWEHLINILPMMRVKLSRLTMEYWNWTSILKDRMFWNSCLLIKILRFLRWRILNGRVIMKRIKRFMMKMLERSMKSRKITSRLFISEMLNSRRHKTIQKPRSKWIYQALDNKRENLFESMSLPTIITILNTIMSSIPPISQCSQSSKSITSRSKGAPIIVIRLFHNRDPMYGTDKK